MSQCPTTKTQTLSLQNHYWKEDLENMNHLSIQLYDLWTCIFIQPLQQSQKRFNKKALMLWYSISNICNLKIFKGNATHNFFSSLWPRKTILLDTLSSSKRFTSLTNWFGDTILDMSFDSIGSLPKNCSNSSFKASTCWVRNYRE